MLKGSGIPPDLKPAYAACALIEQFTTCLQHLEQVTKASPREIAIELETICSRLRSAINTLDTDASFLPIVQDSAPILKAGSIVERLGLGGEIIRLRRELGLTYDEIAQRVGLTPQQVATFVRHYERATPLQRAAIQRRSIFDTTDRLEELAAMIYRQLSRLEGTNDELAVRYTAELRSTIDLAAKLTREIANYQKFQQLVQTVAEILVDEYPQERQRILQRIARVVGNLGISSNLLMGETPSAVPSEDSTIEL